MAASAQILYSCLNRAKDNREAKPDLLSCQSTNLAPAEADLNATLPMGAIVSVLQEDLHL